MLHKANRLNPLINLIFEKRFQRSSTSYTGLQRNKKYSFLQDFILHTFKGEIDISVLLLSLEYIRNRQLLANKRDSTFASDPFINVSNNVHTTYVTVSKMARIFYAWLRRTATISFHSRKIVFAAAFPQHPYICQGSIFIIRKTLCQPYYSYSFLTCPSISVSIIFFSLLHVIYISFSLALSFS